MMGSKIVREILVFQNQGKFAWGINGESGKAPFCTVPLKKKITAPNY